MKKGKLKYDFIKIYKGPKEQDQEENIAEIQTSKEELLRKLRYFQSQSNDLKNISEYYIHDKHSILIFRDFIESIKTKDIEITEENCLILQELCTKYQYYELEETVSNFISIRPYLKKIIDDLLTEINQNQTDQNDEDALQINPDKEKSYI